MPTSILPFSASEIALKWQEQYVSQGVNRDFAVLAPRGITRGFVLGTNVSASTITVYADSVRGDHAAGLPTSTNYVLGIQKSGQFTLNLAAYVGKTVVLALYGSYDVNTSTSAEIRIYQLSPADEFTGATELPNLVVIGTVIVPATGTIPAANIMQASRTDAWMNPAGPGSVTPRQLLRNPSFEYSLVETANTGSHYTYGVLHWTRSGASTGSFVPSSSNPSNSADKRNMVAAYTTTAGAITASMKQVIDVPARAGDTVSLQLKVRCITVPTAGTLSVSLYWIDTDGASISSSVMTVPLSSVDSAYRTVERTFTVPATTARLAYVSIDLAGLALASNGTVFYLDDVFLWFDQRSALTEATMRDQLQSVIAPALTLIPDATAGVSWATAMARALRMSLDASTTEPTVNAVRRDDGTSNHPFLTWRGRAKFAQEKADGLTANLEIPASGTTSAPVNLLWSTYLMSDLTGIQARMYVNTSTRALVFTINAVAQNNATLTWAKDVAGFGAYKFILGSYPNSGSTIDATGAQGNAMPIIQYRNYATGGTWIETGWEIILGAGETRRRGTVSNSIVPEYSVYIINTSVSAQTVNLPAPSGLNANRTLRILDNGSGATRNITVHPAVAGDIKGQAGDYVMNTNYAVLRLWSDGTNWWII